MIQKISGFVLFLVLFTACEGEKPSGLLPSQKGNGPSVVYDLEHKPLPEIPIPNNAATRVDPFSPTGLRLNVSMIAPTKIERILREYANRLDGFGLFMPITVSFDAPLDLNEIVKRHHKNSDMDDDAVYLINIDEKSDGFGEFIALDVGQGNYQATLENQDMYFENDPRRGVPNLLFEGIDEDVNCNGALDWGEDTDGDFVLDKPNTFFQSEDANCNGALDPGEDKNSNGKLDAPNLVDGMATFYEFETNTLIARPIVTLRQMTRYAVVLTNRLKGLNGESVRSPFPYVNHADQTKELSALEAILPKNGLNLDDITFAWVFTTATVTRELELIRAGLYGEGPFRRLDEKFPVEEAIEIHQAMDDAAKEDGVKNMYILQGDMFSQYVLPLVGTLFGINPSVVEELKKDYGAISHFITGTYKTPYFIVDTDGIATGKYPADDDESFKIDPITGNAIVGEDLVTFWCSIPKETSKSKQPFPLAFYSHGYTTNRLEFLGFCGRFARFGIAACGIDAAGHGIDVSEIDLYWSLIEPLLKELKVEEFFWGAVAGRARDLNNDGVPDSGGDFWTNDIFHTRDIVRQSVIDHIQMIRIARGFDGKRVSKFDYDGDGKNELLGDFDADGVPDFGGDAKVYYHFGQSMGGILGGILAGIEPALMAVAPSSGGGGLIDLGIRSSQGGVPEAVFMPMLGPLVSFNPEADGKVTLKFLVNDVNREKEVLFAYSDKIKPLDRIELVNLVNGEKDVIAAPADLKFRMGVAADAVDAATKRAIIGLTDESEVLPVPVTNTTDFGDALEIRIYDGEKGELKEVINKFLMDAEFQGAIYQKGTSLVALVTGYGLKRNSPEFRKFLQYAAMLVEPADPISYARHYFLDPLIFGYEHKLKSGSNALIVHSNGDMAVPVNTGVALARAAGIVDYSKNDICLDIVEKWGDAAYCSGEMAGCSTSEHCKTEDDCSKPECAEELKNDKRRNIFCFNLACCKGARDYEPFYGADMPECVSQNDLAIYFGANEGIERFRRLAFYPFCDCRGTILFDPDDLDQGLDVYNAPSLPQKLRATVKLPDGSMSGLRIPFVADDRGDQHGVDLIDPTLQFDMPTFMINQIGWFFMTNGKEIKDDLCLEDNSCPYLPWNTE